MEGWPEGQVSEMEGFTLMRSFLISVQQWREMIKRVKNCDPMHMSDVAAEALTREIIVREGNLQQMAKKISLELGLPITY